MKKKDKEKLEVIVGIKKNASDIVPCCPIEFYVSDKKIETFKEKFKEVGKSINDLEIDKTLIIKYKPEYNISFNEFKKKITNMVFGHARKCVLKRFNTNKIDLETIIITRQSDKIL